MSQTTPTPDVVRHDVHIYAVVRLKIVGVPGNTDEERIANATAHADLDHVFNQTWVPDHILNAGPIRADANLVVCAEAADEITSFLVDAVTAQGEYATSTWYDGDGVTPLDEAETTRVLVQVKDGAAVNCLTNQGAVRVTVVEADDALDDEECFDLPTGGRGRVLMDNEKAAIDKNWPATWAAAEAQVIDASKENN